MCSSVSCHPSLSHFNTQEKTGPILASFVLASPQYYLTTPTAGRPTTANPISRMLPSIYNDINKYKLKFKCKITPRLNLLQQNRRERTLRALRATSSRPTHALSLSLLFSSLTTVIIHHHDFFPILYLLDCTAALFDMLLLVPRCFVKPPSLSPSLFLSLSLWHTLYY